MFCYSKNTNKIDVHKAQKNDETPEQGVSSVQS